ncbi:hypothetical protein GCM10023084_24450 [Streptomyces lacrimifluminis]|uniref:Integral membrane protein n=1 Tax=Streptomyces lacrimifluminis TaxID=1500077 RepID=A0A917KI00_9ACTN|nr:hypothetical protein [Streptomyces lacrimifluminis]GGJ14735.1 hypothetical protein GCM10012282_08800 [Streptomyces lacrimifluminis]
MSEQSRAPAQPKPAEPESPGRESAPARQNEAAPQSNRAAPQGVTEEPTGEEPSRGLRALPPRQLTAVAVSALLLLQALMLTLFAWPNARMGPRDVPIAIAGPPAAVAPLTQQLDRQAPGAFEVHRVTDEAAARDRIEERKDYGALVVGGQQPRLLVASAASVPVAQLLQQMATGMNEGRQVPVTDVVPAPEGDPRGTGLTMGMLPLILTSMGAGIILSFVVGSTRWRLLGATAFAILGGLASAALLQGWIEAIDGPYLTNAAVLMGLMAAISLTVIGLSVFGVVGTALGVVLMFLVGNPFSGISAGPEMLPEPWGALGQLLPAGASGQLLRSVAFFDGNAAIGKLLIVLAWIALGLTLSLLGAWLKRTRASRAPSAVRPA